MNHYRHGKDKDGSCHEMGKSAEVVFKTSLEATGHTVEQTQKAMQIRHVDFIVDGKHKVEVKSAKRIKRADESPNYELIWVELSSIYYKEGKNGWLYGDADFIAFEQKDDFVFVRRDVLAQFVEEKCDLEDFVVKSKDALYKSYRRWDRPTEHLSLIKMSDILTLKVKRYPKINGKAKGAYFLKAETQEGKEIELTQYKPDFNFENIQKLRDEALATCDMKKIWIVRQT